MISQPPNKSKASGASKRKSKSPRVIVSLPAPRTRVVEPKAHRKLLQTRQLRKEYRGRQVVRGVEIEVNRGEVVGLLGPNGAGKTTSFYMIIGLVRPDGGSVYFNGEDITQEPMFQRARRGMGYLAQEPTIFRKLTVEDNLLAILETLELSAAEKKDRLESLLDELGLTHLARNYAYTLSGGERRRLEITRALVTNPSFIMLDEPFSGVDPKAVHDVQEIIGRLKEKGLGMLLTDHNVRETLSIVDRAYLICDGEVMREGSSGFLVNDPVSRELYLGPRFSM
ncbi:MAG: LPS export ABC transporter ATP-binding protein [Verrucomicrobiae bacterium]|nr:LPS export ABC transporter ATP-binding protein [Verrucomicrobiae bacterium]